MVEKNGFDSIVEPTAQRWFSAEFKAANPAVMEAVRRMIRRTNVQGYLGCAGAFLGLDVEKDLHKIRAPAVYVSGADDKLGGPAALMAGLATKVPGAPRLGYAPPISLISRIRRGSTRCCWSS
jgi:pimeloyl-ACP methyl ester carboxylesterase